MPRENAAAAAWGECFAGRSRAAPNARGPVSVDRFEQLFVHRREATIIATPTVARLQPPIFRWQSLKAAHMGVPKRMSAVSPAR
jgi:hypothetical protein